MAVNDFDAKNSLYCKWVLVITKLVVSVNLQATNINLKLRSRCTSCLQAGRAVTILKSPIMSSSSVPMNSNVVIQTMPQKPSAIVPQVGTHARSHTHKQTHTQAHTRTHRHTHSNLVIQTMAQKLSAIVHQVGTHAR